MAVYLLVGAVAVIGVVLYSQLSGKGNDTYNNVTVDELKNLLKDDNTVLVDVRTKKEINQGVIAKPLEIELGPGMQKKFGALDKNKKYILYCRSGKRSVLASKSMAKMGFDDVNNLLGGYLAWQASN